MPSPTAGAARPRPRCLCLAGPTASGKSAAALAIAEALATSAPVEIVSVDSALVYRGMAIGTAKPSAGERARVPHHLIDLIEPTESYSAARFVADAESAIDDITARGRLPLLVGGTMLYFKALADGLDAMPAADPAVRADIDARAARQGWPALHAELAAIDPVTAARLAPNDAQRIQRALEVFQVSGETISSLQQRQAQPQAQPRSQPQSQPQLQPPSQDRHQPPRPQGADPPPLAMISLEPTDRGWLHQRIARRFERMLADGLIDEVRGLRARGDLRPDLPSMRCVGYRQAWQALDSGDLDRLPEQAISATRQLAKRQLTWLRSMPWRQTVACDAPGASTRVVDLAVGWLASGDASGSG